MKLKQIFYLFVLFFSKVWCLDYDNFHKYIYTFNNPFLFKTMNPSEYINLSSMLNKNIITIIKEPQNPLKNQLIPMKNHFKNTANKQKIFISGVFFLLILKIILDSKSPYITNPMESTKPITYNNGLSEQLQQESIKLFKAIVEDVYDIYQLKQKQPNNDTIHISFSIQPEGNWIDYLCNDDKVITEQKFKAIGHNHESLHNNQQNPIDKNQHGQIVLEYFIKSIISPLTKNFQKQTLDQLKKNDHSFFYNFHRNPLDFFSKNNSSDFLYNIFFILTNTHNFQECSKSLINHIKTNVTQYVGECWSQKQRKDKKNMKNTIKDMNILNQNDSIKQLLKEENIYYHKKIEEIQKVLEKSIKDQSVQSKPELITDFHKIYKNSTITLKQKYTAIKSLIKAYINEKIDTEITDELLSIIDSYSPIENMYIKLYHELDCLFESTNLKDPIELYNNNIKENIKILLIYFDNIQYKYKNFFSIPHNQLLELYQYYSKKDRSISEDTDNIVRILKVIFKNTLHIEAISNIEKISNPNEKNNHIRNFLTIHYQDFFNQMGNCIENDIFNQYDGIKKKIKQLNLLEYICNTSLNPNDINSSIINMKKNIKKIQNKQTEIYESMEESFKKLMNAIITNIANMSQSTKITFNDIQNILSIIKQISIFKKEKDIDKIKEYEKSQELSFIFSVVFNNKNIGFLWKNALIKYFFSILGNKGSEIYNNIINLYNNDLNKIIDILDKRYNGNDDLLNDQLINLLKKQYSVDENQEVISRDETDKIIRSLIITNLQIFIKTLKILNNSQKFLTIIKSPLLSNFIDFIKQFFWKKQELFLKEFSI